MTAFGPFKFIQPYAAIAGTITASITEADIRAGGETIIITLSGAVWVAAGATFDAVRQDIIDGIDSAQSEATGWDAVVKANEVVGSVVRTSDTVVTITLSAHATYDITAEETITVTVPASATSAGEIIATPTFSISSGINCSLVTSGFLEDFDVALDFDAGRGSERLRFIHIGSVDTSILTNNLQGQFCFPASGAGLSLAGADVSQQTVRIWWSTLPADYADPGVEVEWQVVWDIRSGSVSATINIGQNSTIPNKATYWSDLGFTNNDTGYYNL